MASYQTFPKAETNELPAKKHSQASTIAVMVAALCLGAAYVSTTTGPAWAEEFFTGGSQRSTPSSRPRPHYCLRKKRRLDEASIPAALYISVVHSISIPHKQREED